MNAASVSARRFSTLATAMLLPPLLFSSLARLDEPSIPGPLAAPPAAAPALPGGFVGQAVQVSSAPAGEIKKVLQVVGTPGGAVLDQPGGRSLMIVDTPENTGRLIAIKDALDTSAFASARFNVYAPKGTTAEELARQVEELLRNGVISSALSRIHLLPLPVANGLLVISPNEAAWNSARTWLEKLDRSGASRRQVYIYPLDFATEQAARALAEAAKPGERKSSFLPGRGLEIAFDSPTRSLIVYATPAEFQELKNRLRPEAAFTDFKQKAALIARDFEARQPPPQTAPKPPEKTAS